MTATAAGRKTADSRMIATNKAHLLCSAGDCSERNCTDTQKDVELLRINYTRELLGLQQYNLWI